jgi:hypothetical protein
MITHNDAPPNFLRDPKVGRRANQWKKKKIGARSLNHNILKVEGMLELRDGTRTNSQAKVPDDVNLYNQEKMLVSAS